jgi:predicted transcriptional regulator
MAKDRPIKTHGITHEEKERVQEQIDAIKTLIRKRRKELGMNATDLATLAGMSVEVIYRIEKPTYSFNISSLLTILAVLNIDLKAVVNRQFYETADKPSIPMRGNLIVEDNDDNLVQSLKNRF